MLSETVTRFRLLFRDLEEDDIEIINGWLLEEYGTYPYLLTKKTVGDGICLVAVDAATGRVVGFERGLPYSVYPGVFDLCSLIVDPAYRNCGVAKQLTQACIDRLKIQGCRILVSEPVANRPDCASQSTYLRLGFLMTAIQPCMHPGVKAKILGQPESLLLATTAVCGDSGLGHRRIHLPARYGEIPGLLLPRQIRLRRWVEEAIGEMPEPIFHEAYQVGTGIGSEFLDVASNWPEAIEVIEKAVVEGYRFAGLLPGFGLTPDGQTYDVLRLYRPRRPVNFEVIHVTPFMRPLRDFMAQDQCS
jgi:ribosomal protein S18 acetylase RimI-like enzyme